MFKLDPDRPIGDSALEQICLSGSDAVIVGGTRGITYANTAELLLRIRRYDIPCVLEVSDQAAIVDGFDLYFIPIVLNSASSEWMVGRHQQAVRQYGSLLPWERVVAEGYVILNGQSAAAQVTSARTEMDEADVLAYARTADKLFRFPIFYVEYSGAFGRMDWVKRSAAVLEQARLFYGGGIDSAEKAREASRAADTIVVGNVIYDDLRQALETVSAVLER